MSERGPVKDGQPLDCKCGRHMAAKWRWFEGDIPGDSHWWVSSCWHCCEIAGLKLRLTTERLAREVGYPELLRRIIAGAYGRERAQREEGEK
jgi:hypothetical protein